MADTASLWIKDQAEQLGQAHGVVEQEILQHIASNMRDAGALRAR